jgi:hypothetical protein
LSYSRGLRAWRIIALAALLAMTTSAPAYYQTADDWARRCDDELGICVRPWAWVRAGFHMDRKGQGATMNDDERLRV